MKYSEETTKVHIIADSLGNLILFHLIGGTISDSSPVYDLLDEMPIKVSNILDDKAYGSQKIREYITIHETTYKISSQSNVKNSWNVD
ncbi:transposase [Bacillus sp. 196mf]|uniref:transposase n=1 Tax=Bacillus sp. 196mf TaxID=1761754 RepID=UPI000D7C404A|nr:transposase [Bacillus sp. 196mf]